MKLIIRLNLIILILLFTTAGFSQRETGISNPIDSLLKKEYHDKKFNGNVLVVQKGMTLYEKSFGYADPSQKVELDKNFKFQIGSVYKEFPAIAIMQLYEKGLTKLEDNLDKYIPELPSWSKDVSIKDLLQYSSGLPDIDYQKHPPEKLVTYQEIFNDILNTKQLQFKPGTSYLYTNYSPLLLMKIVENVTHQTFSNYAKEYLFNSDDIVIKDEYPYRDTRLMAIPFDEKYQADPFKIAIPFMFASNARGLYDWFKRINQNVLISEESKEFLGKTADILTDNFMQSPLGTVRTCQKPLSDAIEIVEHTHDGTFGNFRCIARRFNEIDLSIIIF